MPTTQGTNRLQVLVESMCRSLSAGRPPDTEDFRQFATELQVNIQSVLPGGNWVVPGGTKATGGAAPAGVGFSVSGKNGVYTVTITNPANTTAQNIWHEVSYGPLRSFSQNVTTLPPSTGTSFTVQLPGNSLFFRLRSSFDLANWSSYQLASTTAVASGLISSSATSEAGAFNQTNFAVVTSQAVGATTAILVQGPNAPLTSWVRQKGPLQRTLPGATIVGITPATDQYVGFDGSKYVVRNTLAGVLADDSVIPVGKVSVVGTGAPVLPTVALVLGAGGSVIAWNVTSPGNGLTGPVTLTINTVTGTGATAGAQTIENGHLVAIAPGNPGALYAGGDTVTVSGGVGVGTPGGGTAAGTNGGRLTNV